MVNFDNRIVEALRQSTLSGKRSGLDKLEVIFFFKELIELEDCGFYKYIEEEYGIARATARKALAECINETTEQAREECKNGTQLVFTAKKVEYYGVVTKELADIIEVSIRQVEEYQKALYEHVKDLMAQYSLDYQDINLIAFEDQVFGLIDINVCVSYIFKDLVSQMPNDVAKFIKKIGLIPMRVKADIAKRPIDEIMCEMGVPIEHMETIRELLSGDEQIELDVSGLEEWKGVEENYSAIQEKVDAYIPKEAQSFLKVFALPRKRTILERKEEAKHLWNILSRKNKRNAIIFGEEGVGKTAMVQKLAEDIQYMTCPKGFVDYKIMSLNIMGMITEESGELWRMLANVLANDSNIILFIDQIHQIVGDCYLGDIYQIAIERIAQSYNVPMVVEMNKYDYEEYFSNSEMFKRQFEKVEIREPEAPRLYSMIKAQISDLEWHHGVKISKDMAFYAMLAASAMEVEKREPARTLDLIDRSMAVAKNCGKKRVTKKDILDKYEQEQDKLEIQAGENPVMMGNDRSVVEVFSRAQDACEEQGLEEVDTIFLFRELMREEDCLLYEYLEQICGISKEKIENTLEECIRNKVRNAKRAMYEAEYDYSDTLVFETDLGEYTVDVADELSEIIDPCFADTSVFEQALIATCGEIFKDINISITTNQIMWLLLARMPRDIAKFFMKLGVKKMEVLEDLGIITN